jgi:acetyltransferase-like isoleucine patch superfamily enzyme
MKKILSKIKFWLYCDRIGPDIPITHWLLYSDRLGRWICRKKFKKFSDGAFIRPGVYAICCSKIELGSHVVLRPGVMLFADPREEGEGISIEDKALIGSSVHMYVSNHHYGEKHKPIYDQGHSNSKGIVIKKGAWIGANVTILPGVTVGMNSVVGAGSVVTTSIPDFSVAVGNPAKVIKQI